MFVAKNSASKEIFKIIKNSQLLLLNTKIKEAISSYLVIITNLAK